MSRPILPYAFMAHELHSVEWEQLEAVSRLRFTEPQRDVLLTAMNRFLEYVSYQEAAPSTKSVRRRMRQIGGHAKALAAALSDPSELGQASLHNVLPAFVTDPAALIRLLHDITLCARAAEESLYVAPGRPPNIALPTLINTWHVIYLEAGGTGRGCSWDDLGQRFTGPFLDLLDTALQQAASPLGNAPLAQAIRIPRNTLAQAIKDAF